MKTFKIPLHSVIDIITNSSTEIFTFSDNTIEPCTELLQEILNLLGIEEKVEDLFTLKIEPDMDGFDTFVEYELDYEDEDLHKLFSKKLKGLEGETRTKVLREIYDEYKDDFDMDYFELETNLIITPKLPEHEKLAEKMIKFLYSTYSEEHNNG